MARFCGLRLPLGAGRQRGITSSHRRELVGLPALVRRLYGTQLALPRTVTCDQGPQQPLSRKQSWCMCLCSSSRSIGVASFSAYTKPYGEARHRRSGSCTGTGDACDAYNDWHFGVVRHLGETAIGSWQLAVTDGQAHDTGTWTGWNLKLWGR